MGNNNVNTEWRTLGEDKNGILWQGIWEKEGTG
jgi:hypothetical protein